MCKSLGKLRQKCLRARVGVRLEYAPELIVRIVLCRLKGCCYLSRMVRIVINDCIAVAFALNLETAVNTAVGGDSLHGGIKPYAEGDGGSYCCKAV